MSTVFDKLTVENVQRGLAGSRLAREVRFFSEIGSTNVEALRLASRNAGEGTLILADSQQAGKGRRSRTWHSPGGRNLYFSLLLRPGCEAGRVPWLGLAAGIAVSEAIGTAAGLFPRVKWPNDVLVSGRKAAGILLEQSVQGMSSHAVVVGVGVNVNMRTQDFPVELRETATSLRIETGKDVNRIGLLRDLLASIDRWYGRFLENSIEGIGETYWRQLAFREQPIRVDTGRNVLEGTAMGLAPDGALRLRLADGRETSLHTGDVMKVRGGEGWF